MNHNTIAATTNFKKNPQIIKIRTTNNGKLNNKIK